MARGTGRFRFISLPCPCVLAQGRMFPQPPVAAAPGYDPHPLRELQRHPKVRAAAQIRLKKTIRTPLLPAPFLFAQHCVV